mmetsp:Transcript_6361/g.21842  ORF Transcript_6361/g.21842 Transcript_6361/m.21842 type:complete len:215 (+) Transcript_6361:1730-2374(+)
MSQGRHESAHADPLPAAATALATSPTSLRCLSSSPPAKPDRKLPSRSSTSVLLPSARPHHSSHAPNRFPVFSLRSARAWILPASLILPSTASTHTSLPASPHSASSALASPQSSHRWHSSVSTPSLLSPSPSPSPRSVLLSRKNSATSLFAPSSAPTPSSTTSSPSGGLMLQNLLLRTRCSHLAQYLGKSGRICSAPNPSHPRRYPRASRVLPW